MRGRLYRIAIPPITVVPSEKLQPSFVTIPKGGEVEVADGSLDADRLFVAVRWDAQALLMFTMDFRKGGEPLERHQD